MLQPNDIRVPNARTKLLAKSFYSMLKREGFTSDQVIDLLLCLLDQVHDEASAELPPTALAAK